MSADRLARKRAALQRRREQSVPPLPDGPLTQPQRPRRLLKKKVRRGDCQVPPALESAPYQDLGARPRERDELSPDEGVAEEGDEDQDAACEPARRRGRPPAGTRPGEPWRGWYRCCGEPFYAGFALRNAPLCPTCGERSQQALMKDRPNG
jgi:hypothetical protein